MDDRKLRVTAAAVSTGRSIAAVVILGYILLKADLLDHMTETEEPILVFFGNGMRVMLILMAVCFLAAAIESGIAFGILLKGEEESTFGRKYLEFNNILKNCAGHVIQIVMGILFVGFGGFAAFSTNVQKAEGTTIVGGVFMVIGIALAVAGVIQIIKTCTRGAEKNL